MIFPRRMRLEKLWLHVVPSLLESWDRLARQAHHGQFRLTAVEHGLQKANECLYQQNNFSLGPNNPSLETTPYDGGITWSLRISQFGLVFQ